MRFFDDVPALPPDPILGLTEAFKHDDRPDKINLSTGVYADDEGETRTLGCVHTAERRLLDAAQSKAYLPIDGRPAFGRAVRELLFGEGSPLIDNGRAVTTQALGGTGALRVAGELIHELRPGATVWLTDPTWPNHPQIFHAAGVATKSFPWYDAATNSLRIDDVVAALAAMPAGDVVLLHGCCHNPSGVDPTHAEWARIAEALRGRDVVPLIDFAYQGFGDGIDEDAYGLRLVVEACPEALICSSFSKNLGLYQDRVGALCVIGPDAATASALQTHVKRIVRSNWSNPAAHGGLIAEMVLCDQALRAEWEVEVARMRARINFVREQLADALAKAGLPGAERIATQRGMFSFTGLSPAQVQRLRDEFGIYIVGSGRINVAGVTAANLEPLCAAIAAVVAAPGDA